MGIKAIHLIFIIASIVVTCFFIVWAWVYAQQTGQMIYKVVSGLSVMVVVAMGIYARIFFQKSKSL